MNFVKAEPSLYGLIMLVGILAGAILWHRRWKNSDPTLFGIFIGGMLGAFIGAKAVYFLAEGWMKIGEPDFWIQLGFGKTIIGALLGGYGGVEFTKSLIGYRKPTGDWFAFMVPLAIAFGRVGCLQHGCCLGKACPPDTWYAMSARWPAAAVELLFNLLALAVLFQLRKFPSLSGQLFHIYLIAYGLFRFVHEFARDTPKWIGATFSGYQVAALLLTGLAVWRFDVRRKSRQTGYSPAR
ncbi:MAG: prolipoprotein diacylglyceryl transferase [Verrucomicrobiales bacterium]|nr:prolipoprotein diacylglyceryl transferase [Verrucomicrobiales bacterium]